MKNSDTDVIERLIGSIVCLAKAMRRFDKTCLTMSNELSKIKNQISAMRADIITGDGSHENIHN